VLKNLRIKGAGVNVLGLGANITLSDPSNLQTLSMQQWDWKKLETVASAFPEFK
jgi:hypothetical protein